MESSFLLVAAPVIGLASNACCQWFVLRLSHGKSIAVSIVSGFVAGLTITIILSLSADAWLMVVNLITTIALGFGYWNFLNLNITSLRIRILKEMLQMDGHRMADEYLRKQYSEGEMLERRLSRLLAAKQIRLHDGRYILEPTPLLLLANILWSLRRIIIPKTQTFFPPLP